MKEHVATLPVPPILEDGRKEEIKGFSYFV